MDMEIRFYYDGVREMLINGDASTGTIQVEILNKDGYRM
jgi:hypothetical protein